MEKSYQGTLPEVIYAHEYGAATYKNKLRLQDNGVEIGYVTKGVMRFAIEEGGGGFLCKKNDMGIHRGGYSVLVSSDEPHSHRTIGFLFNVEGLKGIDLQSFPTVLSASEGVFPLHRLVDEIIEVYNQEPENKLLLGGLALELLSKVAKKVEQTTDERRFGELAYVEKAKKYVYDNARRQIKQTEIAEYLRITPGYLCNVFKRITGETVMAFINRTKLRQIKAVMDRENVKLAKAAEAYGYTDPNYVSRIYKKYFGENITSKNR